MGAIALDHHQRAKAIAPMGRSYGDSGGNGLDQSGQQAIEDHLPLWLKNG